ncbi:hypothetical protein Aab01nite_23810 [Paractinoplanes abujensis]|uniref:DUF2000 domain-containing protein n=1 Tax=Paractinoplanes abujensis TaxID=882441 RepID=A0A7W7G5V4_9ACTN|nr:DUF2000 domain-containing protein [Actinoplanes abujensis]MBB4696745.1 hypothetical protein [Actinoplanes abujensis]GID18791.1 hypothetical protein Aab01nite_23810 [Actinoplanes abujensis]
MIGFTADEIDQSAPTRVARLKWVVVVDADLPPGRAANAAICTAAATSRAVDGLLGDDAVDADGHTHPGLPWAGCTVLAADAETLRTIRAKAAARADFFVADMPAAAQHTRVYREYLDTVGGTEAGKLDYYAVSVVGPRNPVDKLVGKLPLLG